MKIMNFKKFLSYFNIRESFKEVELNKILDKISKKVKLSKREEDFLGVVGEPGFQKTSLRQLFLNEIIASHRNSGTFQHIEAAARTLAPAEVLRDLMVPRRIIARAEEDLINAE